ncbi:RNA recognition motif domain-containing protein [Rhizosphaericola mali]|uniref:RNA-binding protein n=1 Tax=Rhizosphaericola mali TaxID=2545455 RepID=A0A5P2G1X3_9BACT|nr:RNA-binding protein [Rhizosphaericola mali]QES87832.1 RNA-binding protein [Rhizosphaericola mali]
MNIFVSNLSYSVTNEELKSLFEQYGEVNSCVIIMDKFTQRSKGFGFVEISNEEEAEAAIKDLNGKQFGERSINVAQARERQIKSDGGGYRGNKSSNRW